MAVRTRAPREIPFGEIERDWTLGCYWFGDRWCPAVFFDDRGGGRYRVRVVTGERTRGATITRSWDFFECDPTGLVTLAPRGHAKQYKPGRVTGLDDAVAKHAPEDPGALRLGFGLPGV